MAGVAVEQIEQFPTEVYEHLENPLVIIVPEMVQEQLVRQRAARFIGSVAMQTIERSNSEQRGAASLMEAIQLAAGGHEESVNLITTNVSTDVIERTIKAGHVMEVQLDVDESGGIWQYGQAMAEVHANTLRYASGTWQMRERSEVETRNGFRIENANRQKLLDEYYFVVFSLVADNMNKTEINKAGFFEDTMSFAIQATTANEKGLTTESAFVAGVAQPGGELHDKEMVVNVAANLDVDYAGMSTTEILDAPLLIHKSLMPNGVIDIVKWCDDVKETFFGQAKPRQDYVEFREQCRERERSFEPQVEKIVTELITESPHIHTPVEATRRLHKISEKHMVVRAVEDKSIDPRVFGVSAAGHIEVARIHQEMGNRQDALAETKLAISTADSHSCPTGENNSDSTSNEDADCEYISKECPNCGKKNVKTTDKRVFGKIRRIAGSCGCSLTYEKKSASMSKTAA